MSGLGGRVASLFPYPIYTCLCLSPNLPLPKVIKLNNYLCYNSPPPHSLPLASLISPGFFIKRCKRERGDERCCHRHHETGKGIIILINKWLNTTDKDQNAVNNYVATLYNCSFVCPLSVQNTRIKFLFFLCIIIAILIGVHLHTV